jgi:hypothetical protein
MELVLVVTFAGLLGLALRYLIPGRDTYGFAVMPSAAIILGSLGWVVAIWAGVEAAGPWGWVISLGLALVGTLAVGIVLPRKRTEADAELWKELTHS